MNNNKIKLETNKIRIYYYLSNLWSKKNKLSPVINNFKIIQNEILDNDILDEFIKILPLIDENISLLNFIKILRKELIILKKFGFEKHHICYFDDKNSRLKEEGSDNENCNITLNDINDIDIQNIYDFKKTFDLKKISQYLECQIIPLYKFNGNTDNPDNFRYLTNHHNVIKIIDRLWCLELIYKCKNKLPDKNIFISNLINQKFQQIYKTLISNTENLDNIIILDIRKAFDSLDWNIIYKLLLINLTRKINKKEATKLLDEYFLIIKNKKIYYENISIDIYSGIPAGLPSSKIIFQFVLEEIYLRWIHKNGNFKNCFKINIFMDDIYFKFRENIEINPILISVNFTNYLREYGLIINIKKIKVSKNLYNYKFGTILNENDFYLGIPFSRDFKLFGNLILQKFHETYNTNISWNDIYEIIIQNKNCKNCILGFFSYKLSILYGYQINKSIMIQYIKKYFME